MFKTARQDPGPNHREKPEPDPHKIDAVPQNWPETSTSVMYLRENACTGNVYKTSVHMGAC